MVGLVMALGVGLILFVLANVAWGIITGILEALGVRH